MTFYLLNSLTCALLLFLIFKTRRPFFGQAIIPVLMLFISAVFIWESQALPSAETAGPSAIPILWSSCIAATSMIILTQIWLETLNFKEIKPGGIPRLLLFLLVLGAYYFLIEYAGYFACTLPL